MECAGVVDVVLDITGYIQGIIYKPFYAVGIPLNGVHMVISKGCGSAATILYVAAATVPVHGAQNSIAGVHLLQNVNFAAGWPSNRADVSPQHPERRPAALESRYFNASLNPAIGGGEFAGCLQLC